MSGCSRDAGTSTQSIQIRDVESGEISDVASWSMCFDASGVGNQTFRFDNGTTCQSGTTARFNSAFSRRPATTQTSVVRTDHTFTGKSRGATLSLPERHHAKAFRLKPATRHTTGFGSGNRIASWSDFPDSLPVH